MAQHTYPPSSPQAPPYTPAGPGYPRTPSGYPGGGGGGYPGGGGGGYPGGGGGGYPGGGGRGYPRGGTGGSEGGYPAAGGAGYPNRGSRQGMVLADVYNYDDGPSRNFFVKRVFLILSIQLAFTTLFLILCTSSSDFKRFLLRHTWISFVGLGLYMVSSLSINCCPLGRISPWNFLCLSLSTIGMTLVAGVTSVHFKSVAVLAAFSITLLLCLGLTMLACTSFDFTRYLIYAVVFGMVFAIMGIVFSLVFVFYKYIKVMHMVYAGIGVLFTSFMFVMEMQMVLGGRTVELEPDEYVIGALMLYTSIMQIFLNLLQLSALFD